MHHWHEMKEASVYLLNIFYQIVIIITIKVITKQVTSVKNPIEIHRNSVTKGKSPSDKCNNNNNIPWISRIHLAVWGIAFVLFIVTLTED